jgi:PAS domain S-box-containing protein
MSTELDTKMSYHLDAHDEMICLAKDIDGSIIGYSQSFKKLFSDITQTASNISEVLLGFVSQEKTINALHELKINGFTKPFQSNNALKISLDRVYTENDLLILFRVSELFADSNEGLILHNVAGIYSTTPEGEVLRCNDTLVSMLGYGSEEEVLKLNASQLYDSSQDRQAFLLALRETGKLSSYSIRLKRKNGTLIDCVENVFLQKLPGNKEIINGTVIDITDKINAEERYRIISQLGHESVVFLEGDKINDCNEQFLRLLEFEERDELLNLPITNFIPNKDLQRIRHGSAISSNNRLEVRATTRSARTIVLDIFGTTIHQSTKDQFVLVIRDITGEKKTQLALEQTAHRFRSLMENLASAVFLLVDEKIVYLNNAGLQILGEKSEDDVVGLSILMWIDGMYKESFKRDLAAIREGEEINYKEIRMIRSDGESRVDVGVKAALSVYDNRPAIQLSVNDISERIQLVQEQMRIRIVEEINTVLKQEIEEHKRTQKLLEQQKNYNDYLINSSIDMIMASDQEGNLTEFNRAAQLTFGYSEQEVQGLNVRQLYLDTSEFDRVQRTLNEHSSFKGVIANVKKNGQVFRSLLYSSHIVDEKGNVIGAMGISRDISDEIAKEKKVAEQTAKLESIFNSTENLLIWTMNRAHRTTSMNRNFVSWIEEHLAAEAELDTDITDLFRTRADENNYQGQLEAFDYALRGRPTQTEMAFEGASGRTRWLQIFLNPVYMVDRIEEISCVAYDITERKEIDRRIRDALKEKEILLQEVHHRVKNNLQVISSILNLQSGYVTDNATLEILRESQQRIKSMSIIHETLYRTSDFSRINFTDYIKSLINNLIHSYRTGDLQLELQEQIEEVNMNIDQAIPCGLIVNELVSNALKYAYAGRKSGKLKISLKEKKNKVALEVQDNGVGLPDSFRKEKTDSLGIQLVYTLTEQLDGTIEAQSKKGTRFLLTFDKR